MNTPLLKEEAVRPVEETDGPPAPARILPSGRSVVLKASGGQEELEVQSPSGEVEVRILLTENGAVVSLRGARLELESLDTIALSCRRLEVVTTEGTNLLSAGDVIITGWGMRVQAESDIRMNGGMILLNC